MRISDWSSDVCSSDLMLLTAPVVAVSAVLIKITSPGPVLFRQERIGRNGEPFTVLKLRTMVSDAEQRLADLLDQNEADGPLFKMRADPRITGVGAPLRRTSIDELPQLWNVLKGEMSLVGPRPALAREVDDWSEELHGRLRVQPGVTEIGRHTSELQSLMRNSYAVFCLKKKKQQEPS